SPTFSLVSDNKLIKEEPFTGSVNLRFDNKSKRLITESQFGSENDSNNTPIAKWFGLVAIDPSTGIRTPLSGKNVQTDSSYKYKILQQGDFYIDNGFAFYNDLVASPKRILKIDLATGERSEWFNNTSTDDKYNLRFITRMENDETNKVLYVLDGALKAAFKIDPQNKFSRTPVASNGHINTDTSLNYLLSNSLMWDKPRERILINNQSEGTVNAYNIKTGSTSVLCKFGVTDPSIDAVLPINSALDEPNQRVITILKHIHVSTDALTVTFRVDACNLNDGIHSIISDDSTDQNVPLLNPSQIALDINNQKAYTLNSVRRFDNSVYRQNSLVQIDLKSGVRSEVVPVQHPNGSPSTENPQGGLSFDNITGNVYFSVLSSSSIYRTNPVTKTVELMSSNLTDKSTLLLIPKMLFIQNNELITFDSARQTLVAVQPDGKRITRVNLPSTGANPINQVGGILIDSENQRLFLVDTTNAALMLFDQVTGETIFLAR
ncbi:MAG TPA: hypothetical protein PK129_13970, partial [Cellvibrionaceae bacterium]|nr:hypothetical protein [Cellvibrionaceae bacterium]